jgi:hypothetical protein
MKGHSVRRLPAAFAVAFALCLASMAFGAASASAQCCTTYKVNVLSLGGCTSLAVGTAWTGGIFGGNLYTATGLYTETFPNGGCWPSTLTGITINGVAIGTCPGVVNLVCGCVRVCSAVDENTGCVVITIAAC